MSSSQIRSSLKTIHIWLLGHIQRGKIPTLPLTIILAAFVGLLGGYGAVLFTLLINFVTSLAVQPLEDLHRVLDSDISPHLIYAEDIALTSPIAVSPHENLLEALRDFGTRDVETLPVEAGKGDSRRLVGLLQRADVMRRYREEMLRRR